jgi:hypothetical protein
VFRDPVTNLPYTGLLLLRGDGDRPGDENVAVAPTLKYGGHVVGLSKGEWANVKRCGAVLPAGRICPTPKPYSDDTAAKPVEVVPEEKWTEGMRIVVGYAKFLAQELMGVALSVRIVRTHNSFCACYGSERLDFNLHHLGHGWFEQGITEEVDSLLIHEFGHQYSGDHLSSDYHEALCELGARLKRLALEKPERLRRLMAA